MPIQNRSWDDDDDDDHHNDHDQDDDNNDNSDSIIYWFKNQLRVRPRGGAFQL